MKKREGQKFLISDQGKKWIKEGKCPQCAKPESEWKRRTDWRCCSKDCSDKFYEDYGYMSWQTFREKALKRDNYTCVKCGDNRKEIELLVRYRKCTNWEERISHLNGKFEYEWKERKEITNNLIGDHIKPIALGGEEFDLDNVQTLCLKCDKAKTKIDMGNIAKQRRKEKNLASQITQKHL